MIKIKAKYYNKDTIFGIFEPLSYGPIQTINHYYYQRV